jgi:tetratricopeptide (TPR) repeat protein
VDEGIAFCNRALALDESYAKALLKRAELFLKAEKFEEAIQDYELAVERDPSNRGRAATPCWAL